VACHSTAGDFDVLLQVRATDTATLEDILTELRRLGFVRDMQTRVVLRTYFENRPPPLA
jgi:DNA-binding Lrp family transcriptional regulator